MKTSERIPTEAAIKDEPGESRKPGKGRFMSKRSKRRSRKSSRY